MSILISGPIGFIWDQNSKNSRNSTGFRLVTVRWSKVSSCPVNTSLVVSRDCSSRSCIVSLPSSTIVHLRHYTALSQAFAGPALVIGSLTFSACIRQAPGIFPVDLSRGGQFTRDQSLRADQDGEENESSV